ncbi:innexin unc-9-like [Gigantopelta aegis]|uniref:innexin unc-9-like n=1 Tax=Gigantopelta aegis TaxID=1735272 RepID=UPI001B889766|nr:innexin unc-9-like [Gigantopelta aegis]
MLSVIGSLFGSAAKLSGFSAPSDDDLIDRVNHGVSVFILTLFAVVVSTKQFAGDPIKCLMGKEYEGSHVDYTHHLCWIGNTYYVPFGEILPEEEKEREMKQVKYYQWIPVILLTQALLFKIPNVIWKLFNPRVGLNMNKILDMVADTQLSSPDERKSTIHNLARNINNWLSFKRERYYSVISRMRIKLSRFKILCFPLGVRSGTYLVGLYIFIKICYLANSVGQFYLLNSFLSMDFTTYGRELVSGFTQDGMIQESYRFPKITYCDVKIRQLQNLHTKTFQCVLSINLFTEKIFAFLWFWLVAVCVLNVYSLLVWLYDVMLLRNRVLYVEEFLWSRVSVPENRVRVSKFVDDYLRDDGVFVLRVVLENSNVMVQSDLILELWNLFIEGPFSEMTERDKRKEQLYQEKIKG